MALMSALSLSRAHPTSQPLRLRRCVALEMVSASSTATTTPPPPPIPSAATCTKLMAEALGQKDATNALQAWQSFRQGNERLSSPMLDMFVAAHTSQGDLPSALRALHREGAEFKLRLPRSMLKQVVSSSILSFHGEELQGKRASRALSDYGVPRGHVSVLLLMTADLLEGKVGAAVGQLKFLRAARRRVPRALVNAFFMSCNDAAHDEAWDALEKLKLFPDDALVWRMWRWSTTSEPEYSNRLLAHLLARKAEPPSGMFATARVTDKIFQDASSAGRIDQAEIAWKALVARTEEPPTVSQHDSYLYMYLNANQQAKAFRALSQYPAPTLSPTIRAYWIRTHLRKPASLDDALALLQEQHAAGQQVSELAVELLLRACAKQLDLDRAYDIFSSLDDFAVVPSICSVNALMAVCGSVGKAASALRLYGMVQKLNIEPNQETVREAVHACLNGRDIDGAMGVLRELVMEHGVLFEREVLDRVLRRCIVIQRTDLRDEVLQLAIQAGLYDSDDAPAVLAEAEKQVASRAQSIRAAAKKD